MKIEIPELSLIAMVGVSSSGKTTFAGKYFGDSFVLSSDFFRRMVCDDENDQTVTKEAFELLYSTAEKRLKVGRRTVIDATNLNSSDRKEIIKLAKAQDVHAAAIVLNIPEKTLLERNEARSDRHISPQTIRSQNQSLQKSIKSLKKEGFRFVYILSEEDIGNDEIIFTKLWSDKTDEHGPFDIIGDIHGCCDELEELLEKIGYIKTDGGFYHPEGRKAVFIGDLTDRGPRNVDTLRLVMQMVSSGNAICVPGNHDNKLERYLNRRNVQISHGLETTINELEKEDGSFKGEVREFLSSLVSHYRLDDGKLVVAHAGIRQEYIGRASARIREFCLYGDTTGETDDLGMPVRLDWAEDYRGNALIVYGHTPVAQVRPKNNTWCIDTGCVFGGKLTAFRYPEKEIVSVDAHRQYYKPARPLADDENLSGGFLHAEDVTGKLYIQTDLMKTIKIGEEQSASAFETMSRFGADPRWLIYLPPTMSPCETAENPDYLEYPSEAFRYYEKNGIDRVVCEKKHMGSRSVIVLCHTEEAASKRFGVADGSKGIIYTRTGRRFFNDPDIEMQILEHLDHVLSDSGFWKDFKTDWAIFDTELMPWSEKARILLETQYGPVGRAGRESLKEAVRLIKDAQSTIGTEASTLKSSDSDLDLGELLSRFQEKEDAIEGYTKAYREYCWDVIDLSDIRIAPFHLLATEGRVYDQETHVWHMEMIKKYCTGLDPMFMATEYMVCDLSDEASREAGIKWWTSLTGNGGEGMVVKPLTFTSFKGTSLLQPAVKCRGREYLRIIYGPEYLIGGHLERLKKRSLSRKRSLALKEFSLGMESLHRFVSGEPLHRVHECVFGVLALESEPVDSRL